MKRRDETNPSAGGRENTTGRSLALYIKDYTQTSEDRLLSARTWSVNITGKVKKFFST